MKSDQSHPRAAALFAEPLERRRLLAGALPADVVGYAQPGDTFAGIVADATHNHVFVGRGDNVLIVIDADAGKQIATIPLAGTAASLAITPDGASVLVAEPAKHQVEVISAATFASQRVLNVGAPLLQLAGGTGGVFYGLSTTDAALASPDGSESSFNPLSIGQFDLATGARYRTFGLANNADRFVRTDSTGRQLYVGLFVGDDGTGQVSIPTVDVYDVSSPSSPRALAPLLGPSYGRIVDVFADGQTGHVYTANSLNARLELRNADGSVAASYASPFTGEYDNRQMTGLAGMAGGSIVFGVFNDYQLTQNLSLVAFDAATGAVRRTYALPADDASVTAVVTANGRATYVAHNDSPGTDAATASTVGIVGATSLTVAHTHNVISGSVFYDRDGDGTRDAGEDGWADDVSGAPGAVVYADLNGNGKLDAIDPDGFSPGDEPHVFLDDSKTYRLTMPTTTGTYAIREFNPFDSEYLAPFIATGTTLRTVTLGDGAQVAGIDFGIAPGVRVVGTVFADVDGSGDVSYLPGQYDVDEPNVGGAQVFVDVNGDGLRQSYEPISEAVPTQPDGSDTSGWSYALVAPANGASIVRLLNPKGYAVTTGSTAVPIQGIANGRYTVNFAIRPQLAVTGTLYDDANANGKRDASERPWAGARVWLDVDGNGKFTKGEPTARTDVTGAYAIAARERGASSVQLLARDATAHPLSIAQKAHGVLFTDWKQTIAGDLGAHAPTSLSVTAYLDLDKNRKHSRGDRWLAYTIVYLDLDNDGKQDKNEPSAITDSVGHATFADLAAGDYVVRLRASSKLGRTRGTTLNVTLATSDQRELSAPVRVG